MDTQQNVEPKPNITYNSDEMNVFQAKNLIIGLLVILLVLSFLGINILLVIGNLFQAIIDIFGPLVYKILGAFGYTAGAVINKTADVVSDTTKIGIDIAEGTAQSVGNLLIQSSGAVVDPNAKRLLDEAVNTPIRIKFPPPPPITIPVPVPVPVEVKVPVYVPSASNSLVSFNSLLNNPITRFLNYTSNKTPTTAPITSAPVTNAPTVPLPTVPLPTVPLPTVPLPTVPLPTVPLPTVPLPRSTVSNESAAKIQNPISSNKISWCFAGEYQGKRGCVSVEDQSKCLSGQVFPTQQACLTTKLSNTSATIVPTMSSTITNYGNGTMMMNGLPVPSKNPTIEQLQTLNQSNFSPQSTMQSPFLPYIPPQINPGIIQADGPPLVNGPINYFYSYSDKLGPKNN